MSLANLSSLGSLSFVKSTPFIQVGESIQGDKFLLSGDEQDTTTDGILLSGDVQDTASDVLILSGNQ